MLLRVPMAYVKLSGMVLGEFLMVVTAGSAISGVF